MTFFFRPVWICILMANHGWYGISFWYALSWYFHQRKQVKNKNVDGLGVSVYSQKCCVCLFVQKVEIVREQGWVCGGGVVYLCLTTMSQTLHRHLIIDAWCMNISIYVRQTNVHTLRLNTCKFIYTKYVTYASKKEVKWKINNITHLKQKCCTAKT